MASPELVASTSEFRSQITRTILAYFKLWDFLTLRVETALGANLHEIGDEHDF